MSRTWDGRTQRLHQTRPRWLSSVLLIWPLVLLTPGQAHGFAAGQPPTSLSSHTLFGNAKATGATLMLPGPAGAEIRSVLLANSTAVFNDLPADAVIERAYVFWSGSLAQDGVTGPKAADPTVSFTAANGSAYTITAPAGACRTVVHPTQGTTFPPFYYCRAEVTAQVVPNKLGGAYNGTYILGGVNADIGHINGAGQCTEAPYGRCQAKYAAWSMVLIYSSASETLFRDIHLYDGFLILDHEDGPTGSTAAASFVIGDFLADATPQGTLSYFAVETDAQLGQPPQDLYPTTSPFYCSTCQDYVRFNGATLQDERGWAGNLFNESMGVGSGVDIDHIDVSALIPGGSTQATITVGSGTGPVVTPAPSHGGGELFGLGWTLLTLRRPAPHFKTTATNKAVNPTQAGQGETLAYTLNVLNAGSLPATSTIVTDTLPAAVSYKPGSLQVGGAPCTDAADADPCTVSGKTLTINLGTVTNLPPSNSRQVSFLASVAPGATNGQVVCNQFSVVSTQTPTPYSPAAACFTVKSPELNQPRKTVTDLNGGVPGPEDIFQYTVTIPAKGVGPISGISFTDDMPPYLQLLSVIAPPGSVDSSTLTGGLSGKGQVKISNITIPAGQPSASVTIVAQVDSEAELAAQGVPAGSIEGKKICNQGTVSAAFLPASLLTDDPFLAGATDPTCTTLVYSPKLATSSKTAVDVNGGKLEPGDKLRYTLSFVNSGNRVATLSVTDDLPPAVTAFTLVGTVPGATFAPPPAGANGTGRLTVAGLSVPAGGTRTVQFEVTVSATAANETKIQNCGSFTVAERPAEGATRCSPSLTVFAAPDLEQSSKSVTDLNGGTVQPGDTLRYTLSVTNAGNLPATSLVITDVVPATLASVVPLDGGSWNAGTRTLTWSPGALAKGATAAVRFEAKVVVPTPNGTKLCNQGTVTSKELPAEPTDDLSTAAADDPTCVTVVSAPDLSPSEKTVLDLNGAPTRPGDTLRYSLRVRNQGTETATAVTVQDKISTLLTAVTPLDGGTWNATNRTVTWNVGTLAPGLDQTVRFEAKVVTPLVNGTQISNQAFITAAQVPAPGEPTDDPATPAKDDPTVVTVTSAAKLSAQKTVTDVNGGVPQPGDALVYTIRVTNTGDAPARATRVTDVVAASLTSVVPLDGGAWNAATRTITWPAADVVPGTDRVLRFNASLVFPMANGTKVCNQGSVTSTEVTTPVLTDDPATAAAADPTCVTVQSKPDLGLSTKAVQDLNGGKVEPGDTLRYTITVDNVGTQNATAVAVKDVIATNLTNIVALDGGAYDAATRTISWALPQVAAKAKSTLRFTAQVVLPLDDGTKISNQGSITAAEIPTPVLTDDPATPAKGDPTVVTVSSAPRFTTSPKALTDLNGGKLEPGDAVTYTLTLVNTGTSVADQVIVTDVLDPSLELVSVGQGGQWNAATRTITWQSTTTPALLKLPPGQASAVTLTVAAAVKSPLKNGTQVCNQGLVTSQELTAPQKTDNPQTPAVGDPTCATVSSAPDLANASKTVTDGNGAPVRPTDVLTYTITIPNTGNAPATAVMVSDLVDPSLEDVAAGQGGTYDAGTRTLSWTPFGTPALASIAPKASVTLSFTARVRKPLDHGTLVKNQASIAATELPQPVLTDDPATTALDDPTTVTVVSAPKLEGSIKTVVDLNGGEVQPGDVLSWIITLKNSGDAVARSVLVTDPVDASLTAVTPLGGGVYDPTTRVISWTVPQVGLTPAADLQLGFTATVISPLKNGTQIKNQASITPPGLTPVLTDDPSTAQPADATVVTVVSRPDLSGLTKTVTGGSASRRVGPGTLLTYTIEVPNRGTDEASQVVVTDVVDEDLQDLAPQDGGTYDPATRTVTWKVSTVQVGDRLQLRFLARVRPDGKNGDTIVNQAAVEATGVSRVLSDDPTTPQLGDSTDLIIEAIPELSQFTKAVRDVNGGDVVPGDTLEYTLVVRNTGAAYAFDVRVTDPLPREQLEEVAPAQGGKHDAATGVITWDALTTPELAKLAPASEVTLTFTARIRVPMANGTAISNQATVRAPSTSPQVSDDPATPADDDPTVVRVVSAPKLSDSTKSVTDLNGGQVKPGDVLEYVIRAVNSGTAVTTGVILLDTIPSYTTYVPGSTRVNGGPVPDEPGAVPAPTASGVLAGSPGASPGRLSPGDTQAAEVRFRVRVRPETQEGTIISNQGMIRSQDLPLTVTDDPRTAVHGDPTQVVVGSGPNLSATTKVFASKPVGDDGNGKFDVGEVIAYSVTIPNTGTARATGVIFTDPLDAQHGAYVAGSMALNGLALTDTSDADVGVASGQSLRIAVGTIEPGASAAITYQVRITAGPRVVNQGTVRSLELQPELTDADGNETNGDAPTMVPVQGASSRSLRGQKTVLDVNGGEVRPGDELLYTITVFNDGTTGENVDVGDHIPEGASYEGGSAVVPPGAKQSFDPPPRGNYHRGVLRVSNLRLEPGESGVVLLRAILDSTVKEGTSVCNTATLGSDGGLDLQTPLDLSCVLVGSPAGTGGLRGTVFRDLGEDNRVLDERDQKLPRFQVQAFRFGNPNATPMAAAIADEKGVYQLGSLPPGPYTLRVLTANGAQMATLSAVSVPAGQATSRDLPVDPSGAIYEASSGALVAGAQVFLHYDETDPLGPGALVPASLLGQGQQGQQTDATGMYRFDVQQGRSYRLRVQPPSATLQFPSALVPPTAGFAVTGPEHEVVPDDVPDPKRQGARLTYYLRFKPESKDDEVFNNHIPLDPLSSLIRLEKRADRRRASLGDLVTYTITVENRSTRDFLATGAQVGIEDLLPRGLRFMVGTARKIRRPRAGAACLSPEAPVKDVDGSSGCLVAQEPSRVAGQVLRFGPFPLGAGESLRLVYQVAVGLDTQQGLYRNRAVLRDSSFASDLSNTAEAVVAVEPDPDLDQGLLLGKVFCDRNGDGTQSRGEHGLAGARVYLDNGSYAVTDGAGKYHLRNIDPGLHLVKVDVNTLPPGSRLTTDESRVVQFTRGLPAKVNFGALCRENWVEVQRVELRPLPKPAVQRKLAVPGLSLAGDARALRLSVDGKVVPTLEADLALSSAKRGEALGPRWDELPLLRLRRNGAGLLSPALVLNLSTRGQPVRGWTVTIWRAGHEGGKREVVRRFSGAGQPPLQLLWDGTLGRKPILSSSGIYEVQLETQAAGESGASSPVRRFSVDWGRRAEPARGSPEAPTAFLDGARLALDASARFATVIGRVSDKPPLLELRRGDGKAAWVSVLGAAAQLPELDDSSERLQLTGDLRAPLVRVDGKTIDASLLMVQLQGSSPDGALPAVRPDGSLAEPAELKPSFPPVLIRRWVLRITDAAGKQQRSLAGAGAPPASLVWDGQSDQGRPMVQPGAAYLAQLTLEDGQGSLGQSARLVLTAPAAVSFSSLKLEAKDLFDRQGGALTTAARRKLLETARRLRERPPGERYRITVRVAPPLAWGSERWAALLKSVQEKLVALLSEQGIEAQRYELTVGALPLPSAAPPASAPAGAGKTGAERESAAAPKKRAKKAAALVRKESLYLDAVPPPPIVPATEVPRVLVDGEAVPVKDEGTFDAWVRVNLGSALVLDLRDASGRRAVLLYPTKPRTKIPTSSLQLLPATRVGAAGPAQGQPASGRAMSLRMRSGETVVLRLAQASPPGTSGSSTAAAPGPASSPASAPAQSPGSATAPAPAPTSLPSVPPSGPSPLSGQPSRAPSRPAAPPPFGAAELRRAFGEPLQKRVPPVKRVVPAAQLSVDLPPEGAILKSHELALRGRSHPENVVTINGTRVELAADGTFTHFLKLPDGKSELLIRSIDKEGNQGTIRWPVEVSDRALFLMALADGAIGQVGAELDGSTEHTRVEAGPVMMHGRVALYLKGRLQGKRLFKQYFVTAHVDTAKQREFEDFFDQVIDPNRYYPVYGDSAQEVRDVNARDKYYLLIQADRSSLLLGNFNAGMKGIELLQYDRMLYGVKVDYDQMLAGGKLRQQARAFVSKDDARLSRDHNVLRSTGGSIYYLRHSQVLVGSERINVVIREKDTGLVLATLPKSRDLDYVIDYPGGRVLFKAPIPSVADASFGVVNPSFTLSTLAGHPIYIEIDYEYERNEDLGSGSWGAQVKDTLFDILTVGASYVEESRSAEASSSYRLYGGELALRHGASSLTAEFARSQSYDAQNFISEDGGLTYLAMNQISQLSGDARAGDSNAYKVAAVFEASDFFKDVAPEVLRLQGYYSHLDRGFFSDGTILDQGRTKYGGGIDWGITEKDRLSLRHDGAIALLPQIPLPGSNLDPLALREIETELTRLRYEMRRGRLGLQTEYAHSYLRDPTVVGLDSNRDSLGAMASYRFSRRLRLSLGQDAILYHSGNDPQLGTGALGLAVGDTGDWRDRLMTTVGGAIGLTRDLELEIAESVRWSGDNATSAGLKLQISETASVYLRQVLGNVDDRFTTTSVVGAEDRFGRGGEGRTYGEYQIESGISGVQQRAILGLAKTWSPWRGIGFSGGYEHQQVLGGHLTDGTPTGDSQRDVVHLGVEYTRLRRVKLSTRAELRYDNGSGVVGLSSTAGGAVLAPNIDTRAGLGEGYYADRMVTPGSQLVLSPGERWQVVSRSGATVAATRDLTLLGRMNYYRTYNQTESRVEAETLELGVGVALRPVAWDWLNILIKYTRLLEMRPISLTDDLEQRRVYDVVSVAPVLELPFHFELVEKLAYKRVEEDLDLLSGSTLHSVVHTLLWINRLNFHITGRLDAGVEYRFLRLLLANQGDQLRHGALVELGYWVHRYIRLGAGYNFSRFSDNEFADQDRDASGFFFRAVGRY